MPVNLTNMDIGTRYALQEDFDNGFVGRDRQVVIQTDDPKGYRPVIMDGATQGGKNKVALMDDINELDTKVTQVEGNLIIKGPTTTDEEKNLALGSLGIIQALEELIVEYGGTVPTEVSNEVETQSETSDNSWGDFN